MMDVQREDAAHGTCGRCASLAVERDEARALVNRLLTAPGPTYPAKPITDWAER